MCVCVLCVNREIDCFDKLIFCEHDVQVWEVYTNPSVQPGTMSGMPDCVALREILQFANNRGDAVAMAEGFKRNWAMFVGVGDAESLQFNALGCAYP